MKSRTHICFVAIALVLWSVSAKAQITTQRIKEDPEVGASIFRPYFFVEDASVSKSEGGGLKPFYISHFGRHGSRYFSQPKSWQQTIDVFDAASREGILTAEGKALHSAIKAIHNEHESMYGELTPLGSREHRQIASRMYAREKAVFTSKKRTRVRCASSVVTRCLVSMANFTEELSSLAPDLEVSYLAGRRYNDQYLNAPFEYDFAKEADKVIDSLKFATLRPESLTRIYFTDAQRAAVLMADPYAVEMGLYYFWAIAFDLDFLSLDLTEMIPVEELTACCAIDNAIRYAKVAVSEEFGKYTRIKGVRILKDFVEKADDALREDSRVAADLRFAHDSAFLPLCALLGVEGYPVHSIEEAHKNWNAADVVPMCSNLQMVFYKVKGEILVKVLVNEKERSLTGVSPCQGKHYYRWADIRQRIMSL